MARVGDTSVFDADPNATTIIFLPDQVTLGKVLVPMPDDMGVERRYVACLNHLLPDEPLAVHIVLATPLASCTWLNTALCEPGHSWKPWRSQRHESQRLWD